MAKKKFTIPVNTKLKYRKPLIKCDKAVDDIVRIKKNEQSKLYRLRKKFDATTKKGEADKLRREIKQQERALTDLSSSAKQLRSYCNEIKSIQKDKKSIKLQNAAANRKLEKMYGKGQFTKEYEKLNKQVIKNLEYIQNKEDSVNDLLYRVNRGLGFSAQDIIKKVKISKKKVDKNYKTKYKDDFMEDVDDFMGFGEGEFLDEEIVSDEEETDDEGFEGGGGGAGIGEDSDFNLEYSDVFWQMWRDYDKNEKPRLDSYTQVILNYGGSYRKFKGTSLTAITFAVSDMWRYARENGSDTNVEKYISNDGTKLKYFID